MTRDYVEQIDTEMARMGLTVSQRIYLMDVVFIYGQKEWEKGFTSGHTQGYIETISKANDDT